jgi:aminopeptidase YwaD
MNTLKRNLFFSIFMVATLQANSQTFIQAYQNVVNQCSQTDVTANLTAFESFGVKERGTPALQNTLNWLKSKYTSYGYTVSQLQEDSFNNGGSICKNLIVTKIGTVFPNKFVIVCGHYDSTVGTGTNDNGSGVATILEVARLLRNIPTEYSIKFINFAGEEDGLVGSQHYVNAIVNGTNPKMDIKVVFNIDEVGGVTDMTNDTITCERDTGNPSSNNAASNVITNQLINCVQLYSPLNTFLSYAYASDYMTFEANNEVITGFFETNETTHRHSETDLLENMDLVYVYNVAKAATGATMHYAVASVAFLENENFDNDFQVSFFPNPVKDVLNINKGFLVEDDYTFSIIDFQGKVVLNKVISNADLLEKVTVSSLQRGIYLAVLETNNKRITGKIVVE